MRKWLAIIVDDQQSSIDKLMELFAHIEYVEIVGTFQETAKAMTYLRVNPVDFLILDVELGDIDGFQFLTMLPDPHLPTILHTAHQKYEDRGYDSNLVDVLLKPVTASRLNGALRRIHKELSDLLVSSKDEESNVLDNWYDYFMIKGPVRYERQIVWFKNITYIENLNRKIKIYVVGQDRPLTSKVTMGEVLDKLPGRWFKQCHQSYIFNINFFESYKNNEVKLTLYDRKLPVGDKTNYTDFNKFLESEA